MTKTGQSPGTGGRESRSGWFAVPKVDVSANTHLRRETATMGFTRYKLFFFFFFAGGCKPVSAQLKPINLFYFLPASKDSKTLECIYTLVLRVLKVVKYWPEIGKCGYLVWRYLLRRDDMEPAPWTPEGLERIKKLGLAVQVRL